MPTPQQFSKPDPRYIDDIFAEVPFVPINGTIPECEITSLEFSSHDVSPGSLFFCIPGEKTDGHDYAQDAVARKAAGLVVERELPLDSNIPQLLVNDTRTALALCSANFYDNPSRDVRVVGITGTNGKTTTAFLTEHLVKSSSQKAGLIGTVECHIGDEVVSSEHTTPESRDFQSLLSRMRDDGVEACACEVSSHALDLDRTAGTHFTVAAFTNLTQDHLDYHKTMEKYYRAKEVLFTEYAPDTCVICTDSKFGKRLSGTCEERGLNTVLVGSAGDCDVRLIEARFFPHSTEIDLDLVGTQISFTLPLVGRFNVENALVAFGIGLGLGMKPQEIVSALESAPQIPGRLERVSAPSGAAAPSVLVDYAHTPDSVSKAIDAVRAVSNGRLICVFGCGGDRDASKRPKMGRAALAADYAIVTSDNPRTEPPGVIIADIVAGMSGNEGKYEVVPERREAIEAAVKMANPEDVVLIAGKGHEDYQIIGIEKHHFDDREIAAEVLGKMAKD